jgi:hypothetical protein
VLPPPRRVRRVGLGREHIGTDDRGIRCSPVGRTLPAWYLKKGAPPSVCTQRRGFQAGNNSPDVAYQSCSAGSRSCRQQSVVSWRSVCQSHSGVRCPLRG